MYIMYCSTDDKLQLMNGVDAFYLGKKWQMWNYREHVILAPFSHFGNPLPHNHRTSTLISYAL